MNIIFEDNRFYELTITFLPKYTVTEKFQLIENIVNLLYIFNINEAWYCIEYHKKHNGTNDVLKPHLHILLDTLNIQSVNNYFISEYGRTHCSYLKTQECLNKYFDYINKDVYYNNKTYKIPHLFYYKNGKINNCEIEERKIVSRNLLDKLYINHQEFYKNIKIDHITKSGKIFKLDSKCEEKALIRLLKKYNEDNIKRDRTELPNILYTCSNKEFCNCLKVPHKYFCDFYIPTENLIIEVKSKRTYEIDKDKNDLKKKICEEKGYKFEFIII